MKIDDRISNYMSLLVGDTGKSAPIAKKNVGVTMASDFNTDNVTISPVAAQLGEDDAHQERLLAIRKQLSEGTYNISGKDVADKIIKVLKG